VLRVNCADKEKLVENDTGAVKTDAAREKHCYASQRLSSAAASASQQRRQKSPDLARAAVGCNAVLDGALV